MASKKERENKMIKQYQGLVISIVNRFQCSGIPFSDLVQEGNIGLLKAIRKFDPTRGVKFITYATWWVRADISRAIEEHANMIRVPSWMQDQIANTNKEQNKEFVSTGTCSQEEDFILERTRYYLSQHDDCQVTDLRGLENRPNTVDVFTDVSTKFLGEKVLGMIEDLGFREKEVLRHRFSLQGYTCMTCRELGKKLCITASRVHQIEKNVVEKLRFKMLQESRPVRATA